MTNFVKKSLRQALKAIRANLTNQFQERSSRAVCRQIQKIEAYRHARRIALYHPFLGELSLQEIWTSAPYQGKFCYFPALTEAKTLLFLPATPKTAFAENQFGILEPSVSKDVAILPDELDIIFLPLLGFDPNGTRLGMGQGYYDRTLSNHPKAILIGLAYDFQKQILMPEPWDVRMDAVVTPTTIYWHGNVEKMI